MLGLVNAVCVCNLIVSTYTGEIGAIHTQIFTKPATNPSSLSYAYTREWLGWGPGGVNGRCTVREKVSKKENGVRVKAEQKPSH